MFLSIVFLEEATTHLWYRDGINPDVDVAVLGYIPT